MGYSECGDEASSYVCINHTCWPACAGASPGPAPNRQGCLLRVAGSKRTSGLLPAEVWPLGLSWPVVSLAGMGAGKRCQKLARGEADTLLSRAQGNMTGLRTRATSPKRSANPVPSGTGGAPVLSLNASTLTPMWFLSDSRLHRHGSILFLSDLHKNGTAGLHHLCPVTFNTQFHRLIVVLTLVFPGTDGGVNWMCSQLQCQVSVLCVLHAQYTFRVCSSEKAPGHRIME